MNKHEKTATPVVKSVPVHVAPASSTARLPVHNWRAHWLTATEFARVMGRDPQTVYWWLKHGTLAEFGIPVCQFRHGKTHSGRVFIQNVF